MAGSAQAFLLRLRGWADAALDLLWPPQCAACGAAVGRNGEVCAGCGTALPWIRGPRCEVCSQPFPGGRGGEFVCANCRDRGFHFVCALAPLLARGSAREMLHRLKYKRERWLAPVLAGWMAEVAEDERLDLGGIGALVPVPLHPARKRERGYNQAELLAGALGRVWGKPVEELLRRKRFTETQTRFDRAERMRNLRGAFEAAGGETIRGRNLLLVDDVFTTGSTLDECARVLIGAGAGAVWAVTAARA